MIHFNSKLLSAVVLAASVVYGQVGRADVLALYNFTGSTTPNSPAMGSSATGTAAAAVTSSTLSTGAGFPFGTSGTTVFAVQQSGTSPFTYVGTTFASSTNFQIPFQIFSSTSANSMANSLANNKYLSFTVGPSGTNNKLLLESVSLDIGSNNSGGYRSLFAGIMTGTGFLVTGSSVNANGSGLLTGLTVNLTGTSQGSPEFSVATEVRVYVFGTGAPPAAQFTRNVTLDNITLNGVVVPEPGTLMLAGLGISSLIPFAMRRLRGRKSLAGDDGSSSDGSDAGAPGLDSAESL